MSKVAEILLNALIAETQNDPVDFMNVTSETLNISDEDFITALRELEFLGYVGKLICRKVAVLWPILQILLILLCVMPVKLRVWGGL